MAYKFLDDDGMNFEVQNILGHAHAGASDAGEVLSTVERVTDGDAASWVREWEATAQRVAAIADDCDAKGHTASAADTYLRAAVYYAAALGSADGLPDPTPVITRLFTAHRRCFDAHIARRDCLVEVGLCPLAKPNRPADDREQRHEADDQEDEG